MKPMYWVIALLTLCGLAGAGPVRSSPASCSSSNEFRTMTYNIRLDTEFDGPNRWANRRDLFIGQIRLLRPALLGMQEVVPGQRADLIAALPRYAALGGGRDDGKLAGEASPLFVDRAVFAVVSSGMFWLSPTPDKPSKGWDAAFPRVASWAHLRGKADGRTLLAINTHWDHIGMQARLNGAMQIRSWISRHVHADEAVVLLGDFNAPLTEDSLVALTSPPAGTLAMTDSKGASQEVPIGASITFNGYDPMPKNGDTIDHVLVGPGLTVRRYHALAENFDGRLASDHFPVIADLSFTRPAKGCAARPRA